MAAMAGSLSQDAHQVCLILFVLSKAIRMMFSSQAMVVGCGAARLILEFIAKPLCVPHARRCAVASVISKRPLNRDTTLIARRQP